MQDKQNYFSLYYKHQKFGSEKVKQLLLLTIKVQICLVLGSINDLQMHMLSMALSYLSKDVKHK